MRSFKYLSTPEAQCQELYAPHVKIFLDRHNVLCYNTCMIDFQNKPFNSDTCNELAQLYGVTSTDIFTAGKAQGLPYIAKRVDISPELEQDIRSCEVLNNAAAKRIMAKHSLCFNTTIRAIKQLGFTYVTLKMERPVKKLSKAEKLALVYAPEQVKRPAMKRTNQRFKKDLSALEDILAAKSYVTNQELEELRQYFNTSTEVVKLVAGTKYNPTLEDFKIP